MKRFLVFLLSLLPIIIFSQTSGDQTISGRLSISPVGTTPNNTYNGNLVITKPESGTAQYINLIREGRYPWSIGMVFNSNTFAIGTGFSNENQFVNPQFVIQTNGNIGVGTVTPAHRLQINGSDPNVWDVAGFYNSYAYGNINKAETRINIGKIEGNSRQPMGAIGAFPFSNHDSSNGILVFYTRRAQNLVERLRIDQNGRVGIGTTIIPAEYKLAVEGKIIAEEIMIRQRSNWPDYVFNTEYPLMPIAEVESFVLKNSHLPGIPSAATVSEDGVSIGEMQRLLLLKVEELTLYIIQQENRISELEQKLTEK